jgi:hypothetical protein
MKPMERKVNVLGINDRWVNTFTRGQLTDELKECFNELPYHMKMINLILPCMSLIDMKNYLLS